MPAAAAAASLDLTAAGLLLLTAAAAVAANCRLGAVTQGCLLTAVGGSKDSGLNIGALHIDYPYQFQDLFKLILHPFNATLKGIFIWIKFGAPQI